MLEPIVPHKDFVTLALQIIGSLLLAFISGLDFIRHTQIVNLKSKIVNLLICQ
jgi:hypothetical protein